jgi:hypothetical protein
MRHRHGRLLRGLAALALAAGGLVLVTAAPAHANNNGQWSVSPTGTDGTTPRDWFEYQLRPGQTLRDLVSVSNLTDNPMTFAIYPSDAYNTPLDGAFALRLQKDTNNDAGSWIHLGYETLDVPAHSRADLAFEIAIPPDAAPGDHAAGIIAEDTTPADVAPQGQGVNIQRRVGTRVYFRVDGPLQPSLQVAQVGSIHTQALLPPFTGRGHASIAYEVKNTGNVRLSGQATLVIKGLFGRTIKKFEPVDLPELLPGGSVVVSAELDSLPIIDRVYAEVTVTAPGVKTVRSAAFWDIPWLEVLIVVLLVGLEAGRRRYKRRRDPQPDGPPPKPKNVEKKKEPALV